MDKRTNIANWISITFVLELVNKFQWAYQNNYLTRMEQQLTDIEQSKIKSDCYKIKAN